MNVMSLYGPRLSRIALLVSRKLNSCPFVAARRFCSKNFSGGEGDGDDSEYFEEPLKRMWKSSFLDLNLDEFNDFHEAEKPTRERFSARRGFVDSSQVDADRVLGVLQQDGPGFDSKTALDKLGIRVSGLLVRKVLLGFLTKINHSNKIRCANLGFKFFIWSGQQGNYQHTSNSYHLLMKIFVECEEFKALWRLVDEMIDKGLPTSARTLNILICACREVGIAKKVIERFIRLKTFKCRPFKHSYNAILLSLLALNHYVLIEWVYQQMLSDGHSADILTYNVVMMSKYRLGKLDQFHRLLDEMGRNGFDPDLHTYNILLHALGKGNKPLAAVNLMNHMRETGIRPSLLHFTTLMDGLSRAGNLEACKFFFDEIPKNDYVPDVVCYTVMITGFVVAGDLEKAREMFDKMIVEGQAPNAFTYNSMIRGLCLAGRFDEACSMLEDMESRGCRPNFLVYRTLISNLRKAGKLSVARRIIRQMEERGRYVHLIQKFKGYRRY